MKNKKGFSLVELLVVIAIIGILALLVLPNFLSSFINAGDKAMIVQENEVVDSARLFLEDYCKHPLKENRGQCSTYSLNTSVTNKKYTCLNVIQSTKYIDDIISQGQMCNGFIVYSKEYKDYKAYIQCGEGYQTSGINDQKDSNGRRIIELCQGTYIPPTPTPDPPTPTIVENYQNTTTNKKYATLNEAFSEVANNQTIKVLQNVTETTTATLASGKTGVKLDLNGKTITMSNKEIENSGELDIYNTSSTTGKIDGGREAILLTNRGTLTLNGTSSSNKIIIDKTLIGNYNNGTIDNSSNITINSNVEIKSTDNSTNGKSRGIYNNGTITMIGGSIISNEGIYNTERGQLTVSGNNTQILCTGTGITSYGNITISGGTISGDWTAITNRGVLNISGSSTQITSGTSYGIGNEGTATITGGTITGTRGIGINVSDGATLTLGNNSNAVSTTSPVIQTKGSPGAYGVKVGNGSTFNFYDGIVKSSSGQYYSLGARPNSIPDGYEVHKETSNGIESAYLKPLSGYTATFYYNSNNTIGSLTVATATATCTASSGGSCTVTVPDVVRNSVGKYNSNYKGVSTTLGNMNNSSLTINGDTKFYANYQKNVLIYYYGTAYTSKTYYRNEYFSSASTTVSRISDTQTGNSNYTTASGPGSSVWTGLSITKDTTPEYTSVQDAADTNITSLYTIYQFNVNFYKGVNVSSIGSDNSDCMVTSTSESCTVVLPTITPNSGYVSAGWNTSSGATTGTAALGIYTIEENGTKLYANAKLPTGTLMAGSSGGASTKYLNTTINKNQIEKITFANSKGSHTANGTNCWDVSVEQNGSVLAWSSDSDSDGLYELTIGSSESKVKASSGSYLFANLTKLVSLTGLSYLDTSQMTTMFAMFYGCSSLTSVNLSYFNTANVTNMHSVFYNCENIETITTTGLNTSKVTDFSMMFNNCPNLTTLDVSVFDTSQATRMDFMFYNCKKLTTINVSGFNTAKVTNMKAMFYNCYKVTVLDVSGFNTSKVTDMHAMFNGCNGVATLNVSGFNTANVTDMGYMFWGCENITSLNLSGWNTAKVTNMHAMFYTCSKLASLSVGSFNTSLVTDMASMFENCKNIMTLNVSNFNTAKVTDMSGMFAGCLALTSLTGLTSFNTSNVTNMSAMFQNLIAVTALNVSSFNTSKVTNMRLMFSNCYKITSLDLTSFNTSKVTNMSDMFATCSKLVTIKVSSNFVTTALEATSEYHGSYNMFAGCSVLKGGSGTTYSSSHVDGTYARIDGGTSSPGYFTRG